MRDEMTDEAWTGSLLDTTFKPHPGSEARRQSFALIVAYLKLAASKGVDSNLARYALRKELTDNIAPLQVVLRRARRHLARSLDPVSARQPSAKPSSGLPRA